MRILILGANGMLGSDLISRLKMAHEVVGKDKENFDLADPASCQALIAAVQPQVIINAAAYTDVDGAEKERETCYAINAQGVANVATICREEQIKCIHISTDYVFDGTKGALYTEDDLPQPINAYGASKRAGEEILMQSGADYIIVRTAWLYGKKGKNFVTTILEKAKEGQRLRVVDDQVGSPTYTWDLAGAIGELVALPITGIFHITNRGLCSWYELACKILKLAGMSDVPVDRMTSKELERPAPRPAFSGLSTRKFTEVTGKTLRFWPLALEDFLVRDLRLTP